MAIMSPMPARTAFEVVPSDAVAMRESRGVYVGVTGDIRVRTVDGDLVTFTNVPAGLMIQICCTHVMATGTTASGIVGMV